MFKCEIAKEKGGCLVITFIGFHSKTSIIKLKVEQGRRAALVGGGGTECGIGSGNLWEPAGVRERSQNRKSKGTEVQVVVTSLTA